MHIVVHLGSLLSYPSISLGSIFVDPQESMTGLVQLSGNIEPLLELSQY